MSGKSKKSIWILPLIEATLISMKHTHTELNCCICSVCLCVYVRACVCVSECACAWCCEFGVTSYILLHEPVLKGADKSFGVDVWSAQREKRSAGRGAPPGLSAAAQGVSILGLPSPPLTPRDSVGGWVGHNNLPLRI